MAAAHGVPRRARVAKSAHRVRNARGGAAYGRATVTAARQSLGRAAEELAARRLRSDGFRIVERNARTRSGELDLIAIEGDVLAFVEVKAGRLGALAGPERPALAVGRAKQLQLRRLAREWMAGRGRLRGVGALRFDVIGVSFDAAGRVVEFEHIRNAF
jgi:putative endonuclease